MKSFALALMSFFVFNSAQAASHIIHVASGTEVTEAQFFEALQLGQNIILGEKHYTPAVQLGEAAVIQGVIGTTKRPFTLGWEFLDATARTQVDQEFDNFTAGKITAQEFIKETQGASDDALSYVPVLETVKKLGGALLPLNLTRAEKAPVVTGGMTAADPKLVPPGFEMGDANYYERFVAAMGGHGDPAEIKNYFAAQCLTDDVMAWHLLTDSRTDLKFMIAGDFHTDYMSAAVARIHARAPELKTIVVRITDATDYTDAERAALPTDPKYGAIADYIYFVNLP